uniref:Uncharacterized protein n=1 Tax=Anguilla anguilla TaxID=7936 RepID=A0A0E9R0D9_ANGAN
MFSVSKLCSRMYLELFLNELLATKKKQSVGNNENSQEITCIIRPFTVLFSTQFY